jgi:AraC-like DNA-binding protein
MRDSRLEAAIEISVLCGEQTTVGLLAEVAGLSQPRFSHLFSRQTGTLPGEFLRLMREFRREQLLAIEILGKALRTENK